MHPDSIFPPILPPPFMGTPTQFSYGFGERSVLHPELKIRSEFDAVSQSCRFV